MGEMPSPRRDAGQPHGYQGPGTSKQDRGPAVPKNSLRSGVDSKSLEYGPGAIYAGLL